jgi:tRNA A-37 threonylcarbamoyl transferase component Bud32
LRTESDDLVGLVLGGAYRLVGCIGEGGMGAVYEAHHLRMQKRVAVKLLHSRNARHPDAVERFHREAMIASRLGHPHLVNVIDFGASTGGDPYLVMEFLEGEDLDRRLRRTGQMPLQTAMQIARQAASAVAAVHAKGVVHRDLKPANIFLVHVPGEPDFVKILDFGVSKIRAVQTKLTDVSKAIGTPQYMSPEQAAGARDEVDHRTDQWALACIVWEMLSGRAPFSADDVNAVFYQLANLPPPPLTPSVPNLPSGVEAALLRALSKNPADRYPSIRAFSRALETAALGTWNEMTPPATDVTKIAAVTDIAHVRRLAERARAVLRLDRIIATVTSAKARLGPRRSKALAGLVAVVGISVAALALSRGRHAVMAAGSDTQPRPTTVVEPIRPMPEPRVPQPMEAPAEPVASATNSKVAPSRSSSASSHKHAKKGKALAKAGAGGRKHSRPAAAGRHSRRLTVDDF